MLLAACNVNDPIYEKTHPQHGRITLTTDWSQRSEGVAIPGNYHVRANGDEAGKVTFSQAVNEHPELFTPPGSNRLHIYHDAAEIALSGNTASVGAATRAGEINANPGWFFSCTVDVEIKAGKVHPVTATMQQQVRSLTLIIEPTGGTAEQIESITGKLSGVAGSLDIDTGAHGSPSDVALAFTKIAAGDNAGKWSATVRLLGIAGTEQLLTGTISFADDTPDMPLDSDLSAKLTGFNTGKKNPISLGGTVAETPTGAGFAATITDWVKVAEGVIAN